MGISSSGSNPFISPSNKIPSDEMHHELKTGKWSEDNDVGANNEPLAQSHADGSITLNASSSKSAFSFEELKDLRPGDTIHFTYSVTPAPTEEAPVFAFLKYNDGDQSDSTSLNSKGEITLKVPDDYNPNRPLLMGLHSPKNTSNQAYTISNTSFSSSGVQSSSQAEKWGLSILNSDQPKVLSALKAIDSEVGQIKSLIANFASINQNYESCLDSFKMSGSDFDKKKSNEAFEQLKGSHEEIRQRTGNLINVVSSSITPDIAKQAIGSTDSSFKGKVSEMTDIWHNVASNYARQISTEEKASGVPDSLPVKSSTLRDSSPISQWAQQIENSDLVNQMPNYKNAKNFIDALKSTLDSYNQANAAYQQDPTEATYNAALNAWDAFQGYVTGVKNDITGLPIQISQVITSQAIQSIIGQSVTPDQLSQIQSQIVSDFDNEMASYESSQGVSPSSLPTTGPVPFSPISQWAQQIENSDLVNQMPNYKNAKNFIDALKSTLDSYNQANAAYQQDPTEATYNAALNAWNAFQGYVTGVKNDITGLPIQISQVITSQAIQSIIGQSVTPDQLSQIQSQIQSDFDNEMASYESSQGVSPSSLPTTGPTPYTPDPSGQIAEWANKLENNSAVMFKMLPFLNIQADISSLMSALKSYTTAYNNYQLNKTTDNYKEALNNWNIFSGLLSQTNNDLASFSTEMTNQLASVITPIAAGNYLGQSINPDQASQIQAQMLNDFTAQLTSFQQSQGYDPSTFPTSGPQP